MLLNKAQEEYLSSHLKEGEGIILRLEAEIQQLKAERDIAREALSLNIESIETEWFFTLPNCDYYSSNLNECFVKDLKGKKIKVDSEDWIYAIAEYKLTEED